MYKPKSKRSVTTGSPQKKKELNGLTANKNIDDIRALADISNAQSSLIKNIDSEISTKQDKITLTTTGSSGASTFADNVLNIPQYLGIGSVAGGDLSGSYPNPSVIKLLGNTIPINANGYLKNDGSGGLTWATVSTGITVNTTPITGGTSGRLLFDDAGVVGETNGVNWDKVNNILTVSKPTGAIVRLNSLYSDVSKFQFTQEISVGTPTEIGYISNQFGTGMILSSFNSLYFNAGNAEKMRISSSTGNVLINTTTDAGFKTDINGTLRVQNAIRIFNPAFTNGGTIAHTANSTLYITGGPGAGGENITFGPSNRIFINAGQVRFPSGSVQMSSTLTLGSGNATSTNMLLMQGSITAGSALGRGIGLDTTLVASANNDVLVGLDIAPTYTNGAFTGLTNVDLRTKGAGVVIGSGAGYGAAYGYNNDGLFQFSTSGNNSVITLRPNNTAANYNSSYWSYIIQENYSFKIIPGNYQSLYLRNYSVSGGVYVGGRENANSYGIYVPANTANVLINTTTDAGYKLDVNGTTRLNGNITGVGTLGITIPNVNTYANGSITATPAAWGRPYAVDFTVGAYTLSTMDSQIHFGARNSGVFFNSSQMYTFGIPTQIWGGPTGPNNCSSLHIGVNSTGEYQTGTNYPSTTDNYFYLSTTIVAPNGAIYTPARATPTRRSFIFSALELIFHTGASGAERGRIFSSGNWGIGTTTDAGYKLDVNGTARFSGNIQADTYIKFATGWIRGASNQFLVYDSGINVKASIHLASGTSYFNTGGNFVFGSNSANASAIVQADSTTQGLLPPRMSNAQMLAIATPSEGLVVYDLTNRKLCCYDGATWQNLF